MFHHSHMQICGTLIKHPVLPLLAATTVAVVPIRIWHHRHLAINIDLLWHIAAAHNHNIAVTTDIINPSYG